MEGVCVCVSVGTVIGEEPTNADGTRDRRLQVFAAAKVGELREKSARGGIVVVGAQGVKVALRVGAMIALARLLAPEDFGVQGMVLSVTGLLGLFRDAGLSVATVQRETITHEQTSTLFWINVAMGFGLAALLVVLAPSVAVLYREPRVTWVAIVSALAFVFNGCAVQHQALLQRRMRFGTLASVEVGGLAVSTAIGIGMAVAGWGYWSLVGMAVSLPLATALGVWSTVRWIPGGPRRGCGISSMLGVGGTWTLIGCVVYVSYNVEKLLLGRFWGADVLGLYGRAYQLANLPTEVLNSSVGSVALPALSRMQRDEEGLRRMFLQFYTLVLTVTVPVTVVCAVFGAEIVALLLGPRWLDAAPILKALAPTVLGFAVMNPLSWLLMATAQNRISIATALCVPPAVIGGTILGIGYGPVGVALGYSAGVSLAAVPIVVLCRRAGRIPMRHLARVIWAPVGAGTIAGLAGLSLNTVLRGSVPLLLSLGGGVSVTVAVYAAALIGLMGRTRFCDTVIRPISQAAKSRRGASLR
jgi:PST family polysaccharide transporter